MSVFALYNSKGGAGKTSASVNLAWTAAQSGRKTLLWDLDPQGASSFSYQYDQGLDVSIEKLLSGKKLWSQAVMATAHENLWFLPA